MKKAFLSFFSLLIASLFVVGFTLPTSAATTYELTNVVTSGTNATISIAIHDGTPGTLYYIQAGEITSPGTCTLDPRYLSSGMTITPGTDAQKTATIIYPTPALSIGTTYCAGILTRANLASTTLVPLQLFPEKPFTITQTVVTAPATNPVANDCGAAGNGCYRLLAPLPGVGDNGKVNVSQGIGPYAKSIIKLIIGLIGVLSVLMIVIGGIEYMSTVSGGEKNAAKGRITNAIFGLLLAVSSYVILNTLNPNLVALNITVPGVNLSLSLNPDDPPTETVQVSIPTSGTSGTQNHSYTGLCPQVQGKISVITSIDGGKTKQTTQFPIVTGFVWPSDSGENKNITWQGQDMLLYGGTERTQVTAAGISINSANPSKIGSYKDGISVTSLYNLPASSIAGLIRLKKMCNCDVVVTGATECWDHATHGPGLPAVDLRKTTSLVKYIESNGKHTGTEYFIGTTDFYDEDSAHFHVRNW